VLGLEGGVCPVDGLVTHHEHDVEHRLPEGAVAAARVMLVARFWEEALALLNYAATSWQLVDLGSVCIAGNPS